VIGNGYQWVDGELVLNDCDYLTRWTLKEPIEYAKPSHECEFQENSMIPLKKRLGDLITKWYPLCEHSYLIDHPKDIKDDWLRVLNECKQMLTDDGIDIDDIEKQFKKERMQEDVNVHNTN
jgi:hypothetical protein